MTTGTHGTHHVLDVAHEVHRLAVDVGAPFDDFRARYERAVPVLDTATLDRLQREDAGWDAVLRAAARNAPHEFILYWTLDTTSIMRLAGDRWRCVQYLMGNHTIAQRMFRRDPAVMLYAPLRTMIYEDARGTTWFAFDQPSTEFGSFGDPEVAEVGIDLDHKMAALLGHLGAPVPERLTSSHGPATGR